MLEPQPLQIGQSAQFRRERSRQLVLGKFQLRDAPRRSRDADAFPTGNGQLCIPVQGASVGQLVAECQQDLTVLDQAGIVPRIRHCRATITGLQGRTAGRQQKDDREAPNRPLRPLRTSRASET